MESEIYTPRTIKLRNFVYHREISARVLVFHILKHHVESQLREECATNFQDYTHFLPSKWQTMQNRKLVNFRESRQFNTRRVSLPPCSKPSVAHEMLRCAAMYSAFKMHLFIRNHFFLKIFFKNLYNTVRKVTVNNHFRILAFYL